MALGSLMMSNAAYVHPYETMILISESLHLAGWDSSIKTVCIYDLNESSNGLFQSDLFVKVCYQTILTVGPPFWHQGCYSHSNMFSPCQVQPIVMKERRKRFTSGDWVPVLGITSRHYLGWNLYSCEPLYMLLFIYVCQLLYIFSSALIHW